MAAVPQRAEQEWLKAKKLRNSIVKELELVKKEESTDELDLGHFEAVDKMLEGFRLYCVTIPWLDIRYAKKQETDELLWTTHVFVTTVYRKLIDRLDKDGRIVLKRKVEKLYLPYLKVSQEFYQGYLQRVCAMYEIKDIRRIPRAAELEEMIVPSEHQIVGSAAAEVRDLVVESVHRTLCCLGDLSRYRVLMRSGDRRDWKRPLTIYRLANDLVPSSGYAHHQCGVIADEQHDHLGVIYHFYRALASDQPHPHAMSNLGKKFEKWLKVQPDRTLSHDELLVYWFLKLHAYFYRGKAFRQYEELEEEVLHRFKSALGKDAAQPLDEDASKYSFDVRSSWLRIILVNICAYRVSLDKSQRHWSEDASRSCQFILRLNIRTIHTIAQFLAEQLNGDLLVSYLEDMGNKSAANKLPKPRAIFINGAEEILSLLRVYITWLYYYRADLIRFREFLEPHFGTMCATLGQFLTTICQVGVLFSNLAVVPVLGLEATETVGLRCLNGLSLPEVCRLSYCDGHDLDRALKGRRFEDESRHPDNITWSRLTGIKACALELAKSEFPLDVDLVRMGPHVFPMFSFVENGKTPQSSEQQVETSELSPVVENRQSLPPSQSMPADRPSRQGSLDMSPPVSISGHVAGRSGLAPGREINIPYGVPDVDNSALDSRIYDMVSSFLTPPEAPPTQRLVERSRESSYGMGSSTAQDVFGAVASVDDSPTSPLTSARALPSLPWDYFYNPAPVGTNRPPRRDLAMSELSNPWEADPEILSRPDSSGGVGTLHGASLAGGVFTDGNAVTFPSSPRQNIQEPLDAIFSMQQQSPSTQNPLALMGMNLQPVPGTEQARTKPKPLSPQERFNESLRAHGIRGKLAGAAGKTKMAETRAMQPPLGSPVQLASSTSDFSSPGAAISSFTSAMAFPSSASGLPPVNSPWGVPYYQQTVGMLMPSYAGPGSSNPERFSAAFTSTDANAAGSVEHAERDVSYG